MNLVFRRFIKAPLAIGATVLFAACSDPLSPGSGVVGTPSDPAKDPFAASLGVNLSAMTKKSDARLAWIREMIEALPSPSSP